MRQHIMKKWTLNPDGSDYSLSEAIADEQSPPSVGDLRRIADDLRRTISGELTPGDRRAPEKLARVEAEIERRLAGGEARHVW